VLDSFGRLVFLGDVALDDQRRPTSIADLGGELLEPVLAPRCESY
jgi:hypothetical protein